MNADTKLERKLRRAADDVRATIVRDAAPPPVDELARSHGRWMSTAAALVLIVGLGAALFVMGARRDDDPLQEPPPATATTPATTLPAPADDAALCSRVADVTDLFFGAPSTPDAWATIDPVLNNLESDLERVAPDSDPEVVRRAERFAIFARLAVDLGIEGDNTPARDRAAQADAIAHELVEQADEPACEISHQITDHPTGA